MLPSQSDYKNLHLFNIINVNNDNYYKKLTTYFEEKKSFFKISIILDIPIVFVLALFSTIHFKSCWWLFFIYFLIIFIISFFIICLPVYSSLVKTTKEKEKTLFNEVDKHLTELANQNYFSEEAKAKRLLNQEFELIKIQPLSSSRINLILNNQKLASQAVDFYHKKTNDIDYSTTIFFEQQPLKPVALATINFIGPDKNFSIQAQIPIEYELVNGLVSEQIVYFDKTDYIVNPTIYIDRQHFNEIYKIN
ncbi:MULTISPECIES: hypothetical protein [Vagococcus]|uniref:Uncharacterized protein n=1 Tax=Vagococcus fluvialis bH819 TaxID=1255619 RepID=A0A1X6WRH6_9ENTE|nr:MULTISPECIES: hypothetical protein [Vagococcus]SLM86859.1 hypothetical protein FM121_12230 [Vagococcus fluvialis bH819]HCM88685.1 hypothetical protein [Vagococcus sp.]